MNREIHWMWNALPRFRTYWPRFLFGVVAIGLLALFESTPALIIKGILDGDREWSSRQWAMAIATVFTIQAGLRYYWRAMISRAAWRGAGELRYVIAKRLFSMSPTAKRGHRDGDLVSLTAQDTEAVRMGLGPGIVMITDALFFMMFLPILVYELNAEMAFAVLAPFVFLPFFARWLIGRTDHFISNLQEKISNTSTEILSTLNAHALVQNMGWISSKENQMHENFREIHKAQMLVQRSQAATSLFIAVTLAASLTILISLYARSQASVGTVVAILRLLQKCADPAMALVHGVIHWRKGLVSLSRIQNFMNSSDSLPMSDSLIIAKNPKILSQGSNGSSLGFQMSSDKFTTPDGRAWRAHCTVQPGERVFVEAGPAEGKTLLLALIDGTFEPKEGLSPLFFSQDGRLFNGRDVAGSIRAVPQESTLFSETIRSNASVYQDDRHASIDRDVFHAVDLLGLLQEKKFREYTHLGESGAGLSGGQKQRLNIASAFHGRPSIVLLDDPLSHLDRETVEHISERWEKISQGVTQLWVGSQVPSGFTFDRRILLQEWLQELPEGGV